MAQRPFLHKHPFDLFLALQVLCSWLSNSPNYEEITKWYLGWKSMFSDQVLAHPSIKDKFNEALDIMNRAVSSSVGRWLWAGSTVTWGSWEADWGMALLAAQQQLP